MRKRELPDKSVAGLVSLAGDEENTHALSLLEAAPFLIVDMDTLIWPQPKLAKKLLRVRSGLLPGRLGALEALIDAPGQQARTQAIRNLSWDGAQYAIQYQIKTQDAQHVWVEERGERFSGNGPKATHVRGVILNIQSTKLSTDRAAYLTGHDELTGLWNVTRLTEGLEHTIAMSKRSRRPALFLRLRISNLEHINKSYGYEIGDLLLTSVAERLQETIRVPDMLARIGGVTFGVVLSETNDESLDDFEKRLREILSDTPYQSQHGDLYIEYDVSSTVLADQAHSAFEAFAQTELAQEAPNTQLISKYVPEMGALKAKPSNNKLTEEDILDALNDRRISLAYQPIIDAKTREIHHYECLMRLRTEGGEVVSAWKFILAAEKMGLVDLLDRRALELASEMLRQHSDVHLALNVSAGTVKNKDAADAYIAALRALGPAINRVTLELTETVALEDPAMASRFSVETRSLGCKFAVDDFGAGYTTFRNLMAIEADTIKIDGSFIQGLSHNPNNQTFVRMMVDLAHTFSVRTVAEMVDNKADADLLTRLGVDYLQGYMFGIPSAAPAWRKEAS